MGLKRYHSFFPALSSPLAISGAWQRNWTAKPVRARGHPTCPAPLLLRELGATQGLRPAREPVLTSPAVQSPSRGFPPLARGGAGAWGLARGGLGRREPGGASPRAPGSGDARASCEPAEASRAAAAPGAEQRSWEDEAAARERRGRTGGEPSPAPTGDCRAASRSLTVRTWRRRHPGRPVRDAPPTAPRRLTSPASPSLAVRHSRARGQLLPRCRLAAAPAGRARPGHGPPQRKRNTA